LTINEVHVFNNPYLVVSISKAIRVLAATYSSFMLAATNEKLIGVKLTTENLIFYKSIAIFQFGSQLLKLLQNTGPNPELSQVLSEEAGFNTDGVKQHGHLHIFILHVEGICK
jgi:hypothetical protein